MSFSGNVLVGVSIVGSSTFNTVAGNFIGVDASGTVALGNGHHGVQLRSGAQFNRIGTNGDGVSDAEERNIISNNGFGPFGASGVIIGDGEANHNAIAGNYIGTDVTGTVALGNFGYGVLIGSDAGLNVVGTNGDGVGDAAEGNLISANGRHGVLIADNESNTVAGNLIGTDATGTLPLANAQAGVAISSARDNVIGTNGDGMSDELERNVISGNGSDGVRLVSGASDNAVAGNYIGVDIAGTAALGNTRHGVIVTGGASANLIGTDGDGLGDAAERNVISGNGLPGGLDSGHGVVIEGSSTDKNVVAGNFIGTDATGTVAIGNNHHGVRIRNGAQQNLVGTDADGIADEAERNVISGNGVGVALQGGAAFNVVAGNFIGTDVTGTAALGNWIGSVAGGGVGFDSGAHSNRIGTNGDGIHDDAERNVISANFAGVAFGLSSPGHQNLVAGNFIGADVTGTEPLGNRFGVGITNGSRDNQIGGSPSLGNVIAFNAEAGVVVGTRRAIDPDHGAAVGNSIRANSIHSNGALGIDLDPTPIVLPNAGDGVTSNDSGDTDTGPNYLQNFPVIEHAIGPRPQTEVIGHINSTPNTTLTLDFYANNEADPSGHGEGQRWLGAATVTTNADGDAHFAAVLPGVVAHGEWSRRPPPPRMGAPRSSRRQRR